MIRSDVGVTGFAAPDLLTSRVPEPERFVSTPCSEVLFADRDSFCFCFISSGPNFEFNIVYAAQLASLETPRGQPVEHGELGKLNKLTSQRQDSASKAARNVAAKGPGHCWAWSLSQQAVSGCL